MALVAESPAATQRSLVFLGGPLVLLSGLHARLFGFLHTPDRIRWLPLPIAPRRHWRAAARSHLPAFVLAAALGVVALLAALPSTPTSRDIPSDLGLALEFGYFALIAGLIEPLASALGSMYGRRFPEHSRARELQSSLGGGWTTPEAVVHLYAPAFTLALAVLLAMPGQLSWERWLDGGELDGAQLAFALVPAALAIGLRLAAPALYGRGLWESVPWLVEATRTLAGPPQPEATPAWARRIPDPWVRLLVVQFWRLTPLPYLRLAIVLGLAIYTAARAAPPTGPSIAVAMTAIGVWIVPASTLLRERPARARLCGALPLRRAQRRGRAGWAAASALAAPALLLLSAIVARSLL